MPKGFQVGDPRAVAAGRKGGRRSGKSTLSDDYRRGYRSGWQAGRRQAREWIADRSRVLVKDISQETTEVLTRVDRL